MRIQSGSKPRRIGKRHPLLLYRRTMGRYGRLTTALAIVFAAAWAIHRFWKPGFLGAGSEVWLGAGFFVSLALAVFALAARRMAYVQAFPSYLVIVTPFLKLKVSYRRVRRVYSASFGQLFPPREAGWARSLLEPFYGKTAVVVELNGYPLNRSFLRLFLPRYMFSPHSVGFVVLVPDWMDFSTELDSIQGAWSQGQVSRRS